MSQMEPVADDQQASACIDINTATDLIAEHNKKVPNKQDELLPDLENIVTSPPTPAAMAATSTATLDNFDSNPSGSESASTALSSPPLSPAARPPKTKAYYRVARLPRGEIEHRAAMGRCTYCDDDTHSRTTCAAGRLMRRVPKRVLNMRLGMSLCPLCGDPGRDKHCKATCPDRIELQELLDIKEEAFRNSKLYPAEGKLYQTAEEAIAKAIEEEIQRKLFLEPDLKTKPKFKAKYATRFDKFDKFDWREKDEKSLEGDAENAENADCDDNGERLFQYTKRAFPFKKKTFFKKPMSKTNAPWREGVVTSEVVPKWKLALARPRAAAVADEQHDLISFDTAPEETLDLPSGRTATPTTPGQKQAGKMPLVNLLDTEVTEVVWDNIVILPSRVGSDSEQTPGEAKGTSDDCDNTDSIGSTDSTDKTDSTTP